MINPSILGEGAEVTNILKFEKDFAQMQEIIRLEQNYRSTGNILSGSVKT